MKDDMAERIARLEAEMPLAEAIGILAEHNPDGAAALQAALHAVVAPCTRCGHSTFEHDICAEGLDENGHFIPKRDCQACDCPWYEGDDA